MPRERCQTQVDDYCVILFMTYPGQANSESNGGNYSMGTEFLFGKMSKF